MKFQGHYSITDLEQLSGIRAHTLRMWEKRYGLFKPARTATNIRHYSNEDLKRILNIGQLTRSGLRISRIVDMSSAEIARKITEISLVKTGVDGLIDNLIVAMIGLDEEHFSEIFSDSVLRMGFEDTIQQVIFPFLHRIGVMWQTGGIHPAQEHFMSNIIRRKLIVAIDGIRISKTPPRATVLLFLPENELHELSLLFYHYALKSRGYKTIYLGQTVPSADLIRVAEVARPDRIISVITNPLSEKETGTFLAPLQKARLVSRLLLSGRTVVSLEQKWPAPVRVFRDLQELLPLL